jgi:hypothetical protein
MRGRWLDLGFVPSGLIDTTDNEVHFMRININRLLVALVSCLPLVALAQSGFGDTGLVYLTSANIQIINDGTPRVFVYVPVSNGGCSVTTAAQLVMDSTNAIASAMYATLLQAKATGVAVDISTYGCTSSNVPKIVSIYLES